MFLYWACNPHALGSNPIKAISDVRKDIRCPMPQRNNPAGHENLPPPQFGINRAEVKSMLKKMLSGVIFY